MIHRRRFLNVVSKLGLAAILAVAPSSPGVAAVATTSSLSVGYTTIPLLPESDTIVSVPFFRPAAFTGTSSTAGGSTISVASAPGWAANQFAYQAGTQPVTYFVAMKSGAKEGHLFRVLGNDSASVSVDLGQDTLSGIVAGDRFSLVPYWTLGTLFPAAATGVEFGETAATGPEGTRLLMLPFPGQEINPPPAASFVYSAGLWRSVGALTGASKNDEIVRPDTYFVIQNPGVARTFIASGAVVMEKAVSLVATHPAHAVDNSLVPPRPVPVSLNDSGLIASGAFLTSASAAQRTDVLVIFDNTTVGTSKPAADFYFYANSGWRKIGQPLTQEFGADLVFGPGKAAFIRKASTPTASVTRWINAPTYTP